MMDFFSRMIERQRLPSCTYHSLHEEDEQLRRDSFAEQPIAILSAHKDIQQVARHVAQGQVCSIVALNVTH